jgi:hypothetical protein
MLSSNGMAWGRCVAVMAVTIGVACADENKLLIKIKELGIPSLNGTTPAYYSLGHRQHAEQLQIAIDDMNAFFKERLNVRTNVALVLLDSKGWSDVFRRSYGLPTVVRRNPASNTHTGHVRQPSLCSDDGAQGSDPARSVEDFFA